MSTKKHPYQLLDPSPWPFLISLLLGCTGVLAALFIHEQVPLPAFGASASLVFLIAVLWWLDVLKESKEHNKVVMKGLRIGMSAFILSEILFFFVFFWSFFDAWIGSMLGFTIVDAAWNFLNLNWPPGDVEMIDPWGIPWVNTLILLLSGTSVTWAHHAILHDENRDDLSLSLGITVLLGMLFTALQIFEYSHISFAFKEDGFASLYSSNFYMLTGFHGFHVVIGTIFLAVCFFRAKNGTINKDNHLCLEFAAWYWHFVDVVWLILFVFVYCIAR